MLPPSAARVRCVGAEGLQRGGSKLRVCPVYARQRCCQHWSCVDVGVEVHCPGSDNLLSAVVMCRCGSALSRSEHSRGGIAATERRGCALCMFGNVLHM